MHKQLIGIRSTGKKLLKSSKKAATKAAPSMYEKWVCTGRELPVFVRWEVVFLSVGQLFCPLGGFCAAFVQLFLRREMAINAAAFFHVT